MKARIIVLTLIFLIADITAINTYCYLSSGENCREVTAKTVRWFRAWGIYAVPVYGKPKDGEGNYHAWTQIETPFGTLSIDYGKPATMSDWEKIGEYPKALEEYK